MTDTIIMRGAYAITDPRLGASGVIPAGAVVIMDGTVKEIGPFATIAPKYPEAQVIGDGTQLLMPGLVDAHSHGRGLSPIQKGVRNDFLENALFDWVYMPILPPELTAALCALRHLRSCCTTTVSTMTVRKAPGALTSRSEPICRPGSGSPSHPACGMRASWRWVGR